MIKQLSIENLAVIDRLEVHFQSGLSIISGETGVGKSIIVKAISLALGGRGKPQWLKTGKERLSVSLDFDAGDNPEVQVWLSQRQLEEETGDCIVRRTMDRHGRSRAYINAAQVSLSQLKSLGALLIDISGQNQHQSLGHADRQLAILDARCEHAKTMASVRQACERHNQAGQRLKELESQGQEAAAKKEWLLHQREEIENLAPQAGEYESIDKEQRLLSQREVLLRSLQQAYTRLWEDEEARDIYSALSEVQRQIAKHQALNDHLGSAHAQLEEAGILIKQAADDIHHCLDGIDLSEEHTQKINERLAAYNELARKYKLPPEELAAKQEELQKQIDDTNTIEEEIRQWRQKMDEAEKEYCRHADKLSESRHDGAALLGEEVSKLLNELGMPDSRFKVVFKDQRQRGPRYEGHERVEFQVRTNRGQRYGTIADIASGGELSRINLAMQLAMHKRQTVPCLLFDEVDAGIGGQVAELIGQLLKKLSASCQLICITHLASIAAQGDHHYVVSKRQLESDAQVTIGLLSEKDRRHEIARMMAGHVTRQSLAHAQSLLESKAQAKTLASGAMKSPA